MEHAPATHTDIRTEAPCGPGRVSDLEQYVQIIDNMARIPSYDNLTASLGATLEDLGALGTALYASKTIRRWLEHYWLRFGELFGLLARFEFAANEAAELQVFCPLMSEPARRFCVEEALGLLINFGRRAVGRAPGFTRIELEFSRPEHHDSYARILRCPVTYNARRSRILVDPGWFDLPIETRDGPCDESQQRLLTELLQRVEQRTPVVSRVRSALLRHRGAALPSLEELARRLNVPVRTLARHLKWSGVRYRDLLVELRLKKMSYLIENRRFTAKEVAHHVGFRDVNAFRRAFKRWTGNTVRECLNGGAASYGLRSAKSFIQCSPGTKEGSKPGLALVTRGMACRQGAIVP
ncbi:MAG TPA: AraC family transcriptional regulator ligand-binding domain-containing protein [Steroidobacteraceae bacterium]|nr:AraC family transcriptional regulator ligand-binding domain-containing protein [Steroidobacteraceae bacterium]